MKKASIIAALAIMVSCAANTEGAYTIKGNLKNADGQKIYLTIGEYGSAEIDSAVITNGQFTFKGTLDVPFKNASLCIGDPNDYENKKQWMVALEPTNISVEGDANDENSVVVKGGKVQAELDRMNEEMKPFVEPLNKLYLEQNKLEDQAAIDSLSKLMEPYQKRYSEYVDRYMRTQTSSYYATSYLVAAMGDMKYEELKAIWDKYTPEVQKYGVSAKDIKSELDALEKIRPGLPAPDFTAKDINGKSFTLSTLKGKVVIIDFWASWCGPCRRSNPHMRELYSKYHAKGLDMVYVADDDTNQAAWRKAVEKDQLVGDGFHHLLRGLKVVDKKKNIIDKSGDISEKYAIHYLPTKYLVDKKGKIVCKITEDNEDELEKQIEKLLNENSK